MGRKNNRRSAPQAQMRRRPGAQRAEVPRIDQAILPHGRCRLPHRKLMFHAHQAEKALKQAQALRRSRGQEAHMEVRWYPCDACGAAHLTSREEYTPRSFR